MTSTMAEIVYGTKEEGHVMSDKVSQLATSVYSEFEKMIKRYDEDVVKELMPLIVGILESLDQSYTEKQESEVDQELLREDNEQLLTQYEREKQLRKGADQKLLEMEDTSEEEKKDTEEKMDSLESIVRMLELKNRNATDHLSRMEDKESELKKEYNKIHERYTELMRTHMDYMERAKILMGTDRLADMANSPRSRGGFHLPNLKPVNMVNLSGSTPLRSAGSPPDASSFDTDSPRSGKDSSISLRSELSDIESPDATSKPVRKVVLSTRMSDKGQTTDKIDVKEISTATKLSKISSSSRKSDTERTKSGATDIDRTSSTKETDNVVIHVTSVDDNVFIETNDLAVGSNNRTDTHKRNFKPLDIVSDSKITETRTDTHNEISKPLDVISSDPTQSITISTSRETIQRTSSHKSESESRLSVTPNFPVSPESPEYDDDYMFEHHKMPGLDQTIDIIVATTPELHPMEESMESDGGMMTQTARRNDASIFDEIHIQDEDLVGDVDIGADITGRAVNPADYASSDSEDEKEDRNSTVSDNFFGMGRELENLILENTELLATKNALNIVKDDLIANVDELTSEQEILREEITSLQCVKTKLQSRIKDLEDEVKKTREELDKKNQTAQEQETEDDVPMAQRKRFTRVEMARVLMERNQYKERLMELQEAVRWTEMIRASREHPEIAQSKKKSSIWNFFGNLVAPDPPPPPPTRKKAESKTEIV